jgi:hypothetical protein
MKIGELLELTQSKKLAEIAKESLEIGEKKTVAALKKAGCYSLSGKRGWHFDGDSSVLEQSIYEYSTPSQRGLHNAKKEVSATIEKATVVTNPSSQLSDEPEIKQVEKPLNKQIIKPTNKHINKQVGKPTIQPTKNKTSKPDMKKVTYEIEEWLHDELKIKSIREKRTVSEIVNEIIKKGMQ